MLYLLPLLFAKFLRALVRSIDLGQLIHLDGIAEIFSHIPLVWTESLTRYSLNWSIYSLNLLESGDHEILVLVETNRFNPSIFKIESFKRHALTNQVGLPHIKMEIRGEDSPTQ